MPAVYLCFWNLRRLFRQKALLPAVIVLPAIGALFCGNWFAMSSGAKWMALGLMAVFSLAMVQWQITGDTATGFTRLVRSLTELKWLAECAALGAFAVIMIIEMVVFVLVRGLVY